MSTTTEKKFVSRKPRGFREGLQEELACPHRDLSCCDECAAKYANIVESYGTHYWMRDEAELALWDEMMEAARNGETDLSRFYA